MMKRRPIIVRLLIPGLALALAFCARGNEQFSPETTIRFDTPATNFTQSSPMGNGRLGAMMFGEVNEERIVLNESSMWSGSPQDADRPDACKYLPEIRRLLLEGRNVQAEALINAHFTCKGPGSSGRQYGCYQVLGNLHLTCTSDTNAPVKNYRRVLNLSDAVTRVEYRRGGMTFTREMFVSAPDQVMVLHLAADQPGQISFDVRLDRPERFKTVADDEDGLLMTGQLDSGTDGKGLKYAARVRVLNQGGDISIHGNGLSVRNANEAVLLISAATDYQGFAGRQTKNPLAASLRDINRASKKSYAALRRAHIVDFQRYFGRVSLYLKPANSEEANLPTPSRIEWAKEHGGDPGLAALYFNFGRYLLISSSRPGGLPPNLQGIWAEEIHTPWNGDWHLDVNVEMNYWPAEVCNLSDLAQPLFALISSLQKPGGRTAYDYYHARGWVAHVITNPWEFTSPGEGASWGATTSGSGWLCQHLWDHYLFTRDKRFLRRAYPVMKGAAQFYSGILIEDPTHHWLVTAPAASPENSFKLPDGQQSAISLGSTFESEITRYLFTACIEASEILGVDKDFRDKLMTQRARLAPIQIGPDGRIMEWLEPYKETDLHHRHVSHLWGLYPGDEISPDTTPKLAQAARETLKVRGDDGVGWSLAFKAILWAQLGDGDHAWALVRKALSPAYGMDIRYNGGGGVYPNLFNVDPPFQIDGNFGTTAAIADMLIQSGNGVIHLLPALPDAWEDGTVTGLCARGGFEVDMTWSHSKLVSVTIKSNADSPCRVGYAGKTIALDIKKGTSVELDGNLSGTTR